MTRQVSKVIACYFKIGLVFALALFSCQINAAVIGNAEIHGSYRSALKIEVELFNLYDTSGREVEYVVTELVNVDNKGNTHKLTAQKSFLKSGGLGWVSIVIDDPIYSGEVHFYLEVITATGKTKRKYGLRPFGRESSRPKIVTCPLKSDRMKCVN